MEYEAGPELDRLIAERVMGLTLDWDHREIRAIVAAPDSQISNNGRGIYCRCSGCDRHGFGNLVDWATRCPSPEAVPYSTDHAAAWQVIDHLRATRGAHWTITVAPAGVMASVSVWQGGICIAGAPAPTVPLAICRAALRAIDKP